MRLNKSSVLRDVEEGVDELALRVIEGVMAEVMDLLGVEVMQRIDIDLSIMEELVSDYLGKCEEAESDVLIDKVDLSVNDYREKLGVQLVSVNVVPFDTQGEEAFGSLDAKSPTIGFVLPGSGLHEVQFDTGVNGEEITSLSNGLPIRDTSSHDPNASYIMLRNDSFEASQSVGASLVVTDVDKLNAAGLRHAQVSSDIATAGGVYFCRYTVR